MAKDVPSTRQEDIANIKGGDLQQRRALHAPVTNLSASEDDANGRDLDERWCAYLGLFLLFQGLTSFSFSMPVLSWKAAKQAH